MYCDANGRPDPNGDFELIRGKVCLRDGRPARFSIADFRDGAPRSSVYLTDGSVLVADAQIATFRDSAQGKEFLALLRSSPNSSRPDAKALTADEEAAAIRRHLGGSRPQTVDADIAAARTREEAAYQAQDPNAWRKGA